MVQWMPVLGAAFDLLCIVILRFPSSECGGSYWRCCLYCRQCLSNASFFIWKQMHLLCYIVVLHCAAFKCKSRHSTAIPWTASPMGLVVAKTLEVTITSDSTLAPVSCQPGNFLAENWKLTNWSVVWTLQPQCHSRLMSMYVPKRYFNLSPALTFVVWRS